MLAGMYNKLPTYQCRKTITLNGIIRISKESLSLSVRWLAIVEEVSLYAEISISCRNTITTPPRLLSFINPSSLLLTITHLLQLECNRSPTRSKTTQVDGRNSTPGISNGHTLTLSTLLLMQLMIS